MGDGNDRKRLEKKAERLNVRERVVFAGFVPESEKTDHYCLGDAYVMPSRGEGFGIVYLEAMACGLPTVGGKADGSRDALRDGQLGVLVDPGDPGDIIRGIKEAISQPRRVPEGLEYFDRVNFVKRVHAIVEKYL
jgi:phosphatidylinositol alpha-1,6-mannosyltransferase